MHSIGKRPAGPARGGFASRLARFAAFLALACALALFRGAPTFAQIASGTTGTCAWEIDDAGTLTISPSNGTSGQMASHTGTTSPWHAYRTSIKKVVVDPGVKAGAGCRNLFNGFSACEEMDLANFDTGAATNLQAMFRDCESLTELNLSGFDTGNATNMSSMFEGCAALTALDVSGFDTGNVTSMSSMFEGCAALTALDVSGFDTGNVTNMNRMFYGCGGLTSLDVSEFDTGNVTNMQSMFSGCGRLASLDPSGFDTGNVTNMAYMFKDCESLTSMDLSGFDTGNVTNMAYMFKDCESLTSMDLSGFDTENVTDMMCMFEDCANLTSLGLSGFRTENVKNMSAMFRGCAGLTALDLSGFDTGNVTGMYSMFMGCAGLRSLDLSGFRTGKLTDCGSMFEGCSNLTTLDISGFNTTKVTRIASMFRKCDNLEKAVLGPEFTFKGKNLASGSQAKLMIPPLDATTGKWVREDEAYGPFTPTELTANYDSDMAGTWVWEYRDDVAVVFFDGNGGYVEPQMVCQTGETSPIEIPKASRPGFYVTEWTELPDGGGASYPYGGTITPTTGERKRIYAQWATAPTYTVNHRLQVPGTDDYEIAETETLYGRPGENATVEPKEYEHYVSPSPETVTVAADGSTVVDLYYERGTYVIAFDGNGATSGEMPDRTFISGIAERLPDAKYKKDGAAFMGWNSAADGSGTAYGDAQAAIDVAPIGGAATLYAQWLELPESGGGYSDGAYTFRLKPGQTAVVPNLPAGASYEIEEVGLPSGWEQAGSSGTAGVVGANATSDASISNEYSAVGYATIEARKTMEVGEWAEGEYEFTLSEGSTLLQTATNGRADAEEEILSGDGETVVDNPYHGMSIVVFDELRYDLDDVGAHVYTIKETPGGDASTRYDEHAETVTVQVTDNGDGTLATLVEYDADGPVFTNSKIPVFESPDAKGELEIGKEVVNADTDDEFEFVLGFEDAAGVPTTDEYAVEIVKTEGKDHYGEAKTVVASAVSRTENLDALGNKNSNYGSRWGNANLRGTGREEASSEAHVVTLEGASELHVAIVYGGQGASYDYACAWQGAHPDYSASANSGSSFTGKLGGGNHANASNLKEYDVPGDTVTFSFTSNASGYGDGYGYYAVVTAEVEEFEYNENHVRSATVSNGGVVTLKDGETAIVKGITAGTRYSVSENERDGYELVASEGTSGTIAEGATGAAAFRNAYVATATARLTATKTLVGRDLAHGEFTFELRDGDGELVGTATNGADGSIAFDPIVYDRSCAGRTFEYTITERAGDDETMEYDSRAVGAEVKVTADGTMAVEVSYDGPATFVNVQKYDVVISKRDQDGKTLGGAALRVEDAGGAAAAEFTTEEGMDELIRLAPGTYRLRETAPPPGYKTADDVVFVVHENGAVTIDGDEVESVVMTDEKAYTRSLRGVLWDDGPANLADGERKAGETLLSDVAVELRSVGAGGVLTHVADATTDTDGAYAFEGLDPGNYVVVIDKEPRLTTKDAAGVALDVNSNAEAFQETKTVVRESEIGGAIVQGIYLPTDAQLSDGTVYAPGAHDNYDVPHLDAGFVTENVYTRSLRGVLWDDGPANLADGERKAGEERLSGVTVKLYSTDGGSELGYVSETTTGTDGSYAFAGLDPGNYVVVMEKEPLLTAKDANGVGLDVNSNAEAYQGTKTIVRESEIGGAVVQGIYLPTDAQLAQGTTYVPDANHNYDVPHLDAGYVTAPVYTRSLRGVLWNDGPANLADGERKAGEPLFSGVTVKLYSVGAGDALTFAAETTTNASGAYVFERLSSGNYVVVIEKEPRLTTKDATGVGFGVNSNAEAYLETKTIVRESEIGGAVVQGIYLPTDAQLAQGTEYVPDANHNYDVPHLDAGYVTENVYTRSLRGVLWDDGPANLADGERKAGEALISGTKVELYSTEIGGALTFVSDTTTGAGGAYAFEDLDPGNYVVVIDREPRLTAKDAAGVALDVNSNAEAYQETKTIVRESEIGGAVVQGIYLPTDAQLAQGTEYVPDANRNYDVPHLDAGFVTENAYTRSLRGVLWDDGPANLADGERKAGETLLSGVEVELRSVGAGGVLTHVADTTTGADGAYAFEGLDPGDYVVVIDREPRLTTKDAAGVALDVNSNAEAYQETKTVVRESEIGGAVVQGIYLPTDAQLAQGTEYAPDANRNYDVPHLDAGFVTENEPEAKLKVTKTVEGDLGDRAKEFSFKLEIPSLASGQTIAATWTKGGESGTAAIGSDGYVFTLSHGETIVFEGIAYGSEYVVTEVDGESDGYRVSSENASGVLEDADVECSFVNEKNAAIPTDATTGARETAALMALAFAALAAHEAKKKRRKA